MMRTSLKLFFLCLLITQSAVSANAQSDAGNARRIALIIGNAKYENQTNLKNPVNDALAMDN